MKIYTKTGDRGSTGLFDGSRVLKCDLRIEAFGTIDELNSHLGVAIIDCPHEALKTMLTNLQHQLFELGTDLATPPTPPTPLTPPAPLPPSAPAARAAKIRRISLPDIAGLEQTIDTVTAQLPPLRRFVLPGGTLTAARLHIARTVCRRAERLLVSLLEKSKSETKAETNMETQPAKNPLLENAENPPLETEEKLARELNGKPPMEPVENLPLVYLNRLSDLLFTLARWANQLAGQPDVEWNSRGR